MLEFVSPSGELGLRADGAFRRRARVRILCDAFQCAYATTAIASRAKGRAWHMPQRQRVMTGWAKHAVQFSVVGGLPDHHAGDSGDTNYL